jgi:hypothetical protein
MGRITLYAAQIKTHVMEHVYLTENIDIIKNLKNIIWNIWIQSFNVT